MAIARFPVTVLDCPDPGALARFYAAVLGGTVERSDVDWWTLRGDGGVALDFQLVDPYTPPTWPDGPVPQQLHLDVVVDDLDAGESAVLELGATKADVQPGETFRVFLDPAGHPFCLCAC